MRELFREVATSYARFNAYYLGEVHIASPEVVPNARRDGLEDTKAWQEIKSKLLVFAAARSKEIAALSKARNRPVAKIVSSADKVVRDATERIETGFVTRHEHERIKERVAREEEKVKKALESRKDPDEKALREEKNFAVKKLRSSLNRRERAVINRVLQALHDVLDETNYKKAKEAILAKFQAPEIDEQ